MWNLPSNGAMGAPPWEMRKTRVLAKARVRKYQRQVLLDCVINDYL